MVFARAQKIATLHMRTATSKMEPHLTPLSITTTRDARISRHTRTDQFHLHSPTVWLCHTGDLTASLFCVLELPSHNNIYIEPHFIFNNVSI